MAEMESGKTGGEITLGQKIFDNMFLWLVLGVTFPAVFYFAWGMLEIFVFNNAQLSDYLSRAGIPAK